MFSWEVSKTSLTNMYFTICSWCYLRSTQTRKAFNKRIMIFTIFFIKVYCILGISFRHSEGVKRFRLINWKYVYSWNGWVKSFKFGDVSYFYRKTIPWVLRSFSYYFKSVFRVSFLSLGWMCLSTHQRKHFSSVFECLQLLSLA